MAFTREKRAVAAWTGACAIAAALTGCGGGGGDSSPVAPPPPPVALGLSASAAVAFEGEGPITLTVQNLPAGATATWAASSELVKIASASAGTATVTVPALSTLAADATVTITATVPGRDPVKIDIPLYRSAMTVPAAEIAASAVAGSSPEIQVVASPVVPQTATALYARIDDPKNQLVKTVEVRSDGNGKWILALKPVDSLWAGSYSGTATVTLCSDAACAQPLRGRALALAYTLDVKENTGLVPLVPFAGAPQWTTYQGDTAHTGYYPVTLNPVRLGKRWEWGAPPAGNYPGTIAESPISANGLLYLGAGMTLTALKESDGKPAWSYDASAISWGFSSDAVQQPAFANGRVYFSAGHQSSTFLFSLDAATGLVQWKSAIGSQWEEQYAPVIIGTDVYVSGGSYGGVYGFDKDGGQRFHAYTEQVDEWSPTADDNYLYAFTGYSNTSYLRQYDRRTGALIRAIATPGVSFGGYTMRTAPVLLGNGALLGIDRLNAISRFDVNSGVLNWRIAGEYAGNPAVAKGVIYAANRNPVRLEARDSTTGDLLWTWAPQGAADNFLGPVVVTDNLVFVSTNTAVQAIDLKTRAAVWRYPKPGRVSFSPNGLLVVTSYKTDLYANNPTDGAIVVFNAN